MDDIVARDVKLQGDYTVRMDLSGAPSLKETYSTIRFLPSHVLIRYSIDEDDMQWECTEIRVSGSLLKKSGDVGQRFGDRLFLMFSRPVLPTWLLSLIDTHRPANRKTSKVA